ncbi:hypothetical protein OAV88_03915 [bacterium]|nr:hypothetical protein [bacterium]
MSVEVATKEYDRVKKTEDDLTKEIEQIKVKLKADHKMWVKECHDRLRSKVQRRVRKSVIRSNRQEASEQGWNRPFDGKDGHLFEKWKKRFLEMKTLDDDHEEALDNDEYSVSSGGEDDLGEDELGEDDDSVGLENDEENGDDDDDDDDEDFTTSDSEILSDDTIDKHVDDEGEELYYFDTDNEMEVHAAKRTRMKRYS